MKLKFFLLFLILTVSYQFIFITKIYSEQISCQNFIILKNVKIVNIKDADTFDILYYDLPLTIRLIGVDAFETSIRSTKRITFQKNQTSKTTEEIIAIGKIAKEYFKNKYLNKDVCLILNKKHLVDVYGRILGIILENNNCEYTDKENEIFQRIILNRNYGLKSYLYRNDNCEKKLLFE